MLALLTLGCGPRTPASSDGTDDQSMPDLPAPSEDLPTEYVGILYGYNYGALPTRFVDCDTGEFWEMTYDHSDPGWRWQGSCLGVYNRVRGQLDRSVDPPVVIVEEVLEARWCEPDDCGGECLPVYDSCYQENERSPCDPLIPDGQGSCGPDSRCTPVHFFAVEAGWMETQCRPLLGDGQAGDACEYPEAPWEADTCAHGLRCWNAAGDVTQPGVCVPYCDPTGELGPTCEGTCVQCSGDDRGLCMQGCTGDDCSVDAFC